MLDSGLLPWLIGILLLVVVVRIVGFAFRLAVAVALIAGFFLVLRHFGMS